MTKLNINLNTLFTPNTLKNGQDYFKKSKVLYVNLNEITNELYGEVRGSRGQNYEVEVTLGPLFDDPDEDPISGFCSCPVGVDCKHALALLLAAEEAFGAAHLNDLIGECQNPTIKSLTKNNQKAEQSVLEKRRSSWLHHLKTTAQQVSEQALSSTESGTGKNNNCVVYILEETQYSGGILAQPYLSRYLKKGGFGKPTIYTSTYNCLHHNNWPASMADSDKHILKLAYIQDRIDLYDGEISLQGPEGRELLNKILLTRRCLVDMEKRLPVEQGQPLKGEIRWQLDDQGLQRPSLFDASSGYPLQLLPTDPPCYLKNTHDQVECGELTHLPDARLLGAILEAPPLDETGVEETSKALKSLFKGKEKGKERKSVQLPKKVTAITVSPQPILQLDAIPLGGKNPDQQLARAKLFFTYNDERIPLGSPQDTLPSGNNDHQVIPRQKAEENGFMHQLEPWMEPALQRHSDVIRQHPALKPYDLIMALPGADHRRHWMHFMTDALPDLEAQGWTIEIDDNFPFQFEAISDDDWYAELDESENNWFDLRLGITIDGKSIDLLPLLARQINQLPTLDDLKKMPEDALIPVALPGGKFIQLPAARLRLIAGTLLELFGDRPLNEYQLQSYHAEIWQELYEQLDLPWAGGEKLLALSKKLKNFKRLKSVKPAKELQAELRSYQQHGLSWLQFLREYGLNGILADDMGLGKTLQTLAHLQLEKKRLGDQLPPSLMVCPTSLLHNWQHEANRFTPDLKVHIHHGSSRDSEAIKDADLVITSYGIIQRDFEQLAKTRFHLLALDEAQAVKNPNAKSAKAIRCLRAEHKLCLTGTPMENHLGELWALFDFLMPGFLGARDQFTRFYRTPIERHGNQQQAEKLKKRIAPFMLRRSKDLVAKELPAKTEIIRTTALDGKQRDLYETIRASMEARVQKEIEKKGLARSQIVILDALLKMRQACCDPSLVKLEQAADVKESAKLDLLMDLVQPMVEEGRKILLFSQFTSMLSLIECRLEKAGIPWVKLTGKTLNRKQPIEAFQRGDVPVFLISLKAGGTGLNLTAADTVIHYDPWWNPAAEDQASDRAHRIGQDKPVFVYKLITEGTVEEKIQALKEKKKALADAIYGDGTGKKKPSITAEDLSVLFEPLKQD
ncbi:SNF2-related protein [Endozoicomonas sp.]|uniref:DEAD/DEAH box helicase n=1 Tax=Endozoicomonas sp. TaxID=1892382 RepID=UPI002888404B|nr:DEAD/DEAH box helicase [Endozoicomonas sp.]